MAIYSENMTGFGSIQSDKDNDFDLTDDHGLSPKEIRLPIPLQYNEERLQISITPRSQPLIFIELLRFLTKEPRSRLRSDTDKKIKYAKYILVIHKTFSYIFLRHKERLLHDRSLFSMMEMQS
jgi:hypothetical protein